MNAGRAFELGGVVVPMTAALDLQQQITVTGGASMRRMMNGAAIKQTQWQKLAVTLSGNGWCPLGLDALDYSGPLTLKCGLPRAIRSQSTSIALPVARRTDTGYEPFARAHLADGREVETAVSIAAHVATVSAVAGAVGYAVWYFPQLTVIASPPDESFDQGGAECSWSISAEEE